MVALLVMLKVVGIVLLADFITGFVHWLEDSYWNEDTFILGKWLVIPNLAHHKNGQEFLQKSWLESCWDSALAGSSLLLIAYLFDFLSWEVVLFAVILMNANQIHKWAHITRYENKPKIIGLLQKIYVLQRTDHHGQHHRKPNDTHFCTITNALNPLLDNLKFWRGLEYLFGKSKNKIAARE